MITDYETGIYKLKDRTTILACEKRLLGSLNEEELAELSFNQARLKILEILRDEQTPLHEK